MYVVRWKSTREYLESVSVSGDARWSEKRCDAKLFVNAEEIWAYLAGRGWAPKLKTEYLAWMEAHTRTEYLHPLNCQRNHE